MHARKEIEEELRRVQSGIAILIAAARLLPDTAPDAEFYRSELPLAIEDAEQGVERLSHLISRL